MTDFFGAIAMQIPVELILLHGALSHWTVQSAFAVKGGTDTPTSKEALPTVEHSQLIRDLIIVQLAIAGVGQRVIRAVVGGDRKRISKIAGTIANPISKTAPKTG